MPNAFPDKRILDCSYCGNHTPHPRVFQYEHDMLYDEIDIASKGDAQEIDDAPEFYDGDEELTIWDAELIDDFFRATLEYVNVAPPKIRRMEDRPKHHGPPKNAS